MKKCISVSIMIISILLSCFTLSVIASAEEPFVNGNVWNGNVADNFPQGDGSKESPYIISNASELALLCQLINSCAIDDDNTLYSKKCYMLSADICLNDTSNYETWNKITESINNWTPIGCGYVPISIENLNDYQNAIALYGSLYDSHYSRIWSADAAVNLGTCYTKAEFQGTFDGNEHSIVGLYSVGNKEYQGLFGYVLGGTIKNLLIKESYVVNENSAGLTFAGTLAGDISSNGKSAAFISNCFILKSYIEGGRAGGFSGVIGGGLNYLPTIENCYADVTVCGLKTDNCYAGGFFGDAACHAYNCYVTGIVQGFKTVGGFTGWQEVMDTSFTNCYSSCTVTAESVNSVLNKGGFIGDNELGVSLTNCFWLQTDTVNCGLTESDLYGYAVNETGKLITAGDSFQYINILDVLNSWVSAKNSEQYSIWLKTENGVELSNISMTYSEGNGHILFSIKNNAYRPTFIAVYTNNNRMASVESLTYSSADLYLENSMTVCKFFELDSAWKPISTVKQFNLIY